MRRVRAASRRGDAPRALTAVQAQSGRGLASTQRLRNDASSFTTSVSATCIPVSALDGRNPGAT